MQCFSGQESTNTAVQESPSFTESQQRESPTQLDLDTAGEDIIFHV